MNTLEGFFMLGVLSAYWVFGHFIDSANPASHSWLQVYWLLAALCGLTFVLLLTTPFDERGAPLPAGRSRWDDFMAMLQLFFKPLVCVFVITAFLYVLIEQSVGTWLPTFNNEILKLPAAMSVEVTSIFAGCLALGRLSAGVLMRRLNWFPVMMACVLGMGGDGAAGAAADARRGARPARQLGQRAAGDLPVSADRPVHGADLPRHQLGDAQLPAAKPALGR